MIYILNLFDPHYFNLPVLLTIPFTITLLEAISINLTIFFSAGVNSLTGFGFAILGVPFLALLFPPKVVVPAITIMAVFLDFFLLFESYRFLEIRKVFWLLTGAVVGLPFGAYMLKGLDTEIMKLFIGVATIIFAVILKVNLSKSFAKERLTSLTAGFISGGFGASTAISGPPVVLFGLNQRWLKEIFRANLIGYFAILSLLTIGVFSGFGLFTGFNIQFAFLALPGLFLGFWGGVKLKNRLSESKFRIVAFGLVLTGGILLLVQTTTGFLE